MTFVDTRGAGDTLWETGKLWYPCNPFFHPSQPPQRLQRRPRNERISFHLRVGLRGTPGQGCGPDFGRDTRCHFSPGPPLARRGRDAGEGQSGGARRRDHHRREAHRLPGDRAQDHQAHRLQRSGDRFRRRHLHGAGGLRRAVAAHRARRQRGKRAGSRPGRRRPGPDVRLRLRRDAGPDAAADLSRAPPGRAPVGSAPRRQACHGCARTPSRRSPSATSTASRIRSRPWCSPPSTRRA